MLAPIAPPIRPLLRICLLLALFWGALFQAAPLQAGDPLLAQTEAGLTLHWRGDWRDWPQTEVHGTTLPAYLIPVTWRDPVEKWGTDRRGDGSPQWLADLVVESRAWDGSPLPARLGEESKPTGSLPAAPLLLLRQGQMRGMAVGVVALLPFYQEDAGQIRQVTALSATLPNAVRLDDALDWASLWQTPWRPATPPDGPALLSSQPALHLTVHQSGIHRLSFAELAQWGWDQEPSQLTLHRDGVPVALAVDPAAQEIRFYAQPPGDPLRATDVYWLSRAVSETLPILTRPALTQETADAPRAHAWEPGSLYAPQEYDSLRPGPRGDHWYMTTLRAGPDLPAQPVTLTLTSRLPLLDQPGLLTVTGVSLTPAAHRVALSPGDGAGWPSVSETWASNPDAWSQTLSLPGGARTIQLSLEPGSRPDGLRVDGLAWLRPVALDFGGQGATFAVTEPGRYRLTNLPRPFALYDITDPHRPVRIDPGAQTGGELLLDSGPSRAYLLVDDRVLYQSYLPTLTHSAQSRSSRSTADPRSFSTYLPLLAGAAIQPQQPEPSLTLPDPLFGLKRPQIRPYQPHDWQAVTQADLLYIGPPSLLAGLSPLLAWRQGQGYRVGLVPVQAIYDAWGHAHPSPQAIRNFLRYAAAQGSLQAVTLVGDGTSDPRNYTGRGNINHVPPYLAMVDPWLGQTACDSCYGQLDGPSPLEDPLPDLMVGRIPAKHRGEVDDFVAKLLGYEGGEGAASRALYVADNYRNPDGTLDKAGNFLAAADASAALHPSGVTIERVYYDPVAEAQKPPGHFADPLAARAALLDGLNRGPGFVTFFGHAHHWQWAATDLNVDPPYLLGLYDADLLTNQGDPFVLLTMSCLTAAFHTPAFSGTTIDERLLLHTPGGAVAVWGSTGLGVAYGHDWLQEGFYQTYWQSGPGGDQRMGNLVQAGYLRLFTQGLCCQESLRTFALLGEPLMSPRVSAATP